MRGEQCGLPWRLVAWPWRRWRSPRSPIPGRLPNKAYSPVPNGLSNATILIIRHAEKPSNGAALSPAGEMRAAVYGQFFQHFAIGGTPIHVDTLVAAEDSRKSDRLG
jgi:hypothetical protein